MKIKIIQAGYAGFSGYFGSTLFADGVSVEDVGLLEARRLGSVVAVEMEDGTDPSAAQAMLDAYKTPFALATTKQEEPTPLVLLDHTPESLAAVADAEGIKGLRDIGTPLGIKGTSIAELIGKIMAVSKRRESDVAAQAEEHAAASDADAPANEVAE